MRGGRSPKRAPATPTAFLDELLTDSVSFGTNTTRPFDEVTLELRRNSPNPGLVEVQRSGDDNPFFAVFRGDDTQTWNCTARFRCWLSNEPSAQVEITFNWPGTNP
jgi:hypothetical protein